MVTRLPIPRLLLGLSVACEPAQATRDADTSALASSGAVLAREVDASTAIFPNEADDANEGGLRHAYYSNIVKVHDCVHLNDDGSLRGENCPSTLVVYGPYISAPANSNVHVQFDIASPSHLTLMSDVLSDGARQFHGSLEGREVSANERTLVAYRIRLVDRVRALEARVGIRSENPVSFIITDFKITIE